MVRVGVLDENDIVVERVARHDVVDLLGEPLGETCRDVGEEIGQVQDDQRGELRAPRPIRLVERGERLDHPVAQTPLEAVVEQPRAHPLHRRRDVDTRIDHVRGVGQEDLGEGLAACRRTTTDIDHPYAAVHGADQRACPGAKALIQVLGAAIVLAHDVITIKQHLPLGAHRDVVEEGDLVGEVHAAIANGVQVRGHVIAKDLRGPFLARALLDGLEHVALVGGVELACGGVNGLAQVEGFHSLVFRHLETARHVIVPLDIEVPLPASDELDQLEESEIVREQFGVADHQQVLLRPRHSHVELAVDHRAIRILEDVVRQEVQLVIFLDREAIDDVFPLGALITLHRVDRNIVQGLDAVFVDRVADGRDLVPVGNDHTHGLIDIKVFLFDIIDLHDRRGDDIRLHLIDLVRRGRRFRRPGRDKGDASGGQQIHDAIPAHAQGRQGPVLVRAGHFLEGVIIEGIIGEEGDVVVHPSLLDEQVSQVLIVSVFLKQSLEQGETAIRQQDLIQQGVLYP